jgi:hypothetical protein
MFISFSRIEIKAEESSIEKTLLGDVIYREDISVSEYVISGYLKSGDNITIGIWAGNDWGQQKSMDPGDDLHPYPHRDVFIAIKDSQGKNTTLIFPFTTGKGGAVAYDPVGIYPIFQDAGIWDNKNFCVRIIRDDKYTIEFLGYYPPTAPPAKELEPPYHFAVTKTSLTPNDKKNISYNSTFLSLGALSCISGIIVSLFGFKAKPKKS